MSIERLFVRFCIVAALLTAGAARAQLVIFPAASLAARDNPPADGVPDQLTPQSSNYVYYDFPVLYPASLAESRTFVEFNIAGRSKYGRVTLSFDAFRYNAPHLADQIVDVFTYVGDGAIELEDWTRPSTFAGSTAPIKGWNPDGSNRGEGVPELVDITTAFNAAVDAGNNYLGIVFRKPAPSAINSSDPLGYSDLVTVGNYRILLGSDELVTPKVQCPGDINGDGVADILVVAPDGHTTVRDLNGELVSHFTMGALSAVDKVVAIPDINANGSPELAALDTGEGYVEVRDSLTGAQFSLMRFDANPPPIDLELVDDQTGNGGPEIAVLNQKSVQVKDTLTGGLINNVPFSDNLSAKDLSVYTDLNGNGSPELAVLGDDKDPTRSGKLEVHNLATGNTVQTIWLGKGWRLLQQALLSDRNANGFPEVAVLRVRESDGAVNVVMRDLGTRQGLGSIGFDPNYPPTQLLTIPDVNGNHAEEVIVFGQRSDGMYQKAQVKDSKTHKLLKSIFFDSHYPAQDIATCPDINGNGADELVLLGKRASDGQLKAMIKDAKTGKLIGAVNF